MIFSPTEITDVLQTADACLYKLPVRIDEDILAGRPTSLAGELGIIYDLKRVVDDNRESHYSEESFHGVVAYLKHKISGFSISGTIPYYAIVSDSTSAPTPTPGSGYQLFRQIVVDQVGSGMADQATEYQNTQLAGRYVTIVLDGFILSAGLTDQESYTYNISTGKITFNTPIGRDRVLQIFTYIPTLAGWTLVDSFSVGDPGKPAAGATTLQLNALIGKSVIVSLGGLVLPMDLAGTLSYSFNALTGEVTFNNPLPAEGRVMLYTY